MPIAISSPDTVSAKRYRAHPAETEVGVLAVGIRADQDKPGVELGSAALLGCGLLEHLQEAKPDCRLHHDFTVHTYSEAFEPELVEESERWSSSNSGSGSSGICNTKRSFEVSYACECLSEQVYRQASKGLTALTLGGDHSITIGTAAGTARACRERFGRSPALVWVDARAGLLTPETSHNGSIDGMAVSFLSGLSKTSDGEPFSWLDETSEEDGYAVDLSKLVYIGLRDVELPEHSILKRHHVKFFTMSDIQSKGIKQVVGETLSYIGSETPIHFSFDINAMDSAYTPSATLPVTNGLTVNEAEEICRCIHGTGNMVAMDFVGLNPVARTDEDEENVFRSIQTAFTIIETALVDR